MIRRSQISGQPFDRSRPPGDDSPWLRGSEDQGFVAFLKLIAVLQSNEAYRAWVLISALRGNDLARVIPVVAAGDTRELVSPPSPPTAGAGVRSQLILARLREREAGELVPPPELKVSFIRDQLLDAKLLSGAASELGIQEYVVDNILDRLDGLELDEKSSRSVVEFVWRLLMREDRSAFGLRRSLRDMSGFDPGRWFWFQPGRSDGAEADRQRREHGLASLLLPSRANTWMPAIPARVRSRLGRMAGIRSRWPSDVGRPCAHRRVPRSRTARALARSAARSTGRSSERAARHPHLGRELAGGADRGSSDGHAPARLPAPPWRVGGPTDRRVLRSEGSDRRSHPLAGTATRPSP